MEMLIGGKRVSASDGRTIEVFNPATMKCIGTVPAAARQDVEQAIQNACRGFAAWAATPLFERIEILKRFYALYRQSAEELAGMVVREAGKPLDCAMGEIGYTGEFMEHYIEQARFMGGETYAPSSRSSNAGDLLLTTREPLGVIVSILPFNYPISQLPHKAIGPLLMGNPVILKPSEETPMVDIRFGELLLEAGVPGDVIQVVTGDGPTVGQQLVSDPRVSMVSLTGSTRAGIEIARAAAPNLTRVTLELGGNDPFIILEDADLDYAVAESISGRSFANAGQACCASKRFIVSNEIREEYIRRLTTELRTKKVGDPALPDTDCGPVITPRAAMLAEQHINDAIAQGARLIMGGRRFGETFIEPTVLEVAPHMDIARDQEVFAPVWPVIGFDSVDEAIAIANNTRYGLSSGVVGKDVKALLKVARSVRAGACIINGSSDYRSYDQAFGGPGMTGIGREGARYTMEQVTQLKTIVMKQCY